MYRVILALNAEITGKVNINTADYEYSPGSDGIIFNSVGNRMYTDNTTQANQTAAQLNLYAFDTARISANKSNVTTTNATTVYIEGAPIQDNNMNFSNAKAVGKKRIAHIGGDLSH